MDKTISPQLDLDWSKWLPVIPSNELKEFPTEHGGVFRVSHIDTGGIEYVGRSYSNLRHRVQQIAYNTKPNEEPDGAPLVAAPHLWRLKKGLGQGLLVSWVGIPSGDSEEIDATWAAYLSGYRKTVGKSPAANFGKNTQIHGDLPDNAPFTDSPFSDFRGYNSVKQPTLDWTNWRGITSENWMGLKWNEPFDLSPPSDTATWVDPLPRSSGIYRTWVPGSNVLDRIEATSNLKNRIDKKRDNITNSHKISVCEVDIKGKPSKTELEVDLVGAHYLATNVLPNSDISGLESVSEKAKNVLNRLEDNKVEFKRADFDGTSLGQEMVALANSGGGHIFIGVDNNGKTTEVPDIDNKMNHISSIAHTNIEPALSITTQIPNIESNRVLWVRIPPAYKQLFSINGAFFERLGPTKRPMEWSRLEEFLSDNPDVIRRLLDKQDTSTGKTV